MLKISKLTDYAIVICTHIYLQKNHTASTKIISEKTGIGLATVKKVLRMLVQGNILASEQGITGGYALASPADKISLVDLIKSIEGDLALTECSSAKNSCEVQGQCNITQHWQYINKVVLTALSKVTLNDLAQPYNEWQPVAFEQLNKHIERVNFRENNA